MCGFYVDFSILVLFVLFLKPNRGVDPKEGKHKLLLLHISMLFDPFLAKIKNCICEGNLQIGQQAHLVVLITGQF